MPLQRTPTRSTAPALLAGLLVLASATAGAMALDGQIGPVGLGAPLDVELGLSLDAGETLDPGCVRAEVVLGDRALPADAVRARLAGLRPDVDGPQRARIRVQTTAKIDEPVVELVVHAGCPSRLSRRYVVFADPPRVGTTPVVATAPSTSAAGQPGPSPATPSRPGTTANAASAASAAEAADAPASPAARPAPAPPAAPRPDAAASRRAVAPPSKRAARARTDGRPTPAGADARSSPPRQAPRARLRLDGPAAPRVAAAASEPVSGAAVASAPALAATLSPQTLALVEQANLAVLAAASELRAAQARMAALERRVETLQVQAQLRASQADEWRQLAAQAQTRQRWSWVLLIAVLLLLGLAGWLGWRVRTLERKGRDDWTRAAREASSSTQSPRPASQAPAPGGAQTGHGVRGAGLAPVHEPDASEWPSIPGSPHPPQVDVEPLGSAHATQPLPRAATASSEMGAQGLSTEELIDLEQQAEFFVVLGQDEAAVDLLMAHLRDSAGASPLPYLKLMEIYRRLDDEAAYRRTQQRFNQRFNARAPEWRARERIGHALEDYPGVVAGLQRVWPDPIDAMAQLEALLFRRGGGAVFDLEAYRDLLLLYGIARAVHEAGELDAGSAGMVDVLLPLDTAPMALFERDGAAAPNGAPAPPIGPDPDRG